MEEIAFLSVMPINKKTTSIFAFNK